MELFRIDSLPAQLRQAIAYQNLAAGEALFIQGSPASAFYVVETGRLRLVRYSSSDRATTFQVAVKGESLAEIALFVETYPCTAIAEVASRVIIYPKQILISILRESPKLAESFMSILALKIEALKVRLELRDIRAARERVMQYLHYLTQSNEERTIALDRPFREIATELGLTPESLSRALTRLEREGQITRTERQIILHNSTVA